MPSVDEKLNLSIHLTNLSELEQTETVNNYDWLLATQRGSNTSKKMQLNALGEYTLDELEKTPMVPAGQWNYKSPNTMVSLPTGTIIDDNDVPNIDYVYKTLITKLDALSTQLFSNNEDDLLLPSYKGMVVLGNNIDSYQKLQKLYGSHTEWKKIEGRFILGAGACDGNNNNTYGTTSAGEVNIQAKKFGGIAEAKLNGLPKHSHKFEPIFEPEMSFGKLPRQKISFGVTASWVSGKVDELSKPQGTSEYSNSLGRTGTTTAKGWVKNNNIEPEIVEKEYSFKAQGKILDNANKWKNEPHDNIPPFYATYIWERTK